MINNDTILTIQRICKLTLDGKLDLPSLDRLWPSEATEIPFLEIVYEDVLEGVLHLPSSLIKNEILYGYWRSSYEFHAVYIDMLLLDSHCNFDEFKKHRDDILKKYREMDLDSIKCIIKKISKNT